MSSNTGSSVIVLEHKYEAKYVDEYFTIKKSDLSQMASVCRLR